MNQHIIDVRYCNLIELLAKMEIIADWNCIVPSHLIMSEVWLDDFTPTEHKQKAVIYWIKS